MTLLVHPIFFILSIPVLNCSISLRIAQHNRHSSTEKLKNMSMTRVCSELLIPMIDNFCVAELAREKYENFVRYFAGTKSMLKDGGRKPMLEKGLFSEISRTYTECSEMILYILDPQSPPFQSPPSLSASVIWFHIN